MATKEVRRVSQPDGFPHNPLAMAVAIYRERINRLSPEDQNDLFQLAKDLIRADTLEDWESIYAAMNEILDQDRVQVQEIDLPAEPQPGPGLQSWIDFVSEKIRKFRRQAGLTQEELAEKSGLPQSHISRLEGGKHSPSRATLEKIAAALGVELKEFDPSA
jgi:DNA-binding XRE family transcriptional regulator